ncbi:MAG: DUF6036 family nucleotidyltransferase, partial [Candidatus Paceibacterota bacterium]
TDGCWRRSLALAKQMDDYLVQPLRDFVRLFEELDIPYAIMGGIAVGAHGIPRPTHDLDFTISIERQRLPDLYAAAEQLGYSVPDAFAAGGVDLVAEMPLVRVRQWVEGKAIDIDIFLAESDFQENVLARRVRMEVDAGVAWLVSAEDLILLKLIASRPRDIGDIFDVFLAQGQLDEEYLRKWAAELGVADRLRDVKSQFDLENSGGQT